jgi:hypothetical protein
MRETGRNILAVVLVMIMVYSFLLTIWTYNYLEIKERQILTGKASGVVQFCINTPPFVNLSANPVCNTTTYQNEEYYCRTTAYDPDSAQELIPTTLINHWAERTFSENSSLPFLLMPGGEINFTPDNDAVGFYTYELVFYENVGCSNGFTSIVRNLTVINVNDAPYLAVNLSPVTMNDEETIFAFYLDDYFQDPDLDDLNYAVGGASAIAVAILPNGQVLMRANTCPANELMIFTAIDPYNASADSNPITVTCTNRTITQPSTQGGGGGGGGGSGSTSKVCGKPDYYCYEYHKCNITNQRVEKCIDKTGCERDRLITLPCVYEKPTVCNESWSCTEWEKCLPKGTQSRICTDTNFCGTNFTKPIEMRECEYIGTCDDKIKNCHDGSCEEGIDCGGPCSACKSVQVPYSFKEERGIGIYIFTGILIILLTSTLIYHYFRKEINAALAKASWYLTKKRRKQILLSKEDQKKIIQDLIKLESELSKAEKKEELFQVINKQSELFKYYLTKALQYAGEPDYDSFKSAVEKSKGRVIPILRKIYASMLQDTRKLLTNENLIAKPKIRQALEELRNIVLQTSVVEVGEYSKESQEMKPDEKDNLVTKTIIKMINSYIALQFLEVEVAKKKYLDIISDYEKMSVQEQEMVFQDLIRLYNNITYVNGWAWREKK